mmetsp:Transcript_11083/g.20308  ORF Transcript_11083/g.20308 Transcript_11083/m.20308 type:complete len:94 (-) Transcript_11083:2319-2600(-)
MTPHSSAVQMVPSLVHPPQTKSTNNFFELCIKQRYLHLVSKYAKNDQATRSSSLNMHLRRNLLRVHDDRAVVNISRPEIENDVYGEPKIENPK